MFSQENKIVKKVLIASKPIDIIKKSGSSNKINYDIDYIDTLGEKVNMIENDNTYKLDTICFDPTKFTPPDDWSVRLKTRMRNYETTTTYMDYLFDNK
tara:strand:+ start:7952 stop:8245 length:294 start_codon:yes stop_codon:yes gene_type:complete